jgi:RimJ/RimL family protein N-acetyltransferase
MDDIIALQSAVMNDLRTHEKEHFLIERSNEYFEQQLENPSAVLGIRNDDGMLIAQSIFHHNDTLNPNYIKGITLDDWALCDAVSIMQCAIIHPDSRGQGLLPRMIEAWINWATEKQYKHILTRAEENNTRSISSFTKAGLKNVGSIVDARDGATVCVLHKRLNNV